jgi:type IV pilus assembly protein PilP
VRDARGSKSRRQASGTATAALLLAAALSGCTDDSPGLQAWMDETRANTRKSTGRIPEPKRFEPFRYASRVGDDPFAVARLRVTPDGQAVRNRDGMTPDPKRRREPLEAFPLDAIRLVGHIYRASSGSVALLEADKVNFQAKVGSYVGQHFGRITRISETEVGLREVVQDAAGEWVQRETSLALQEPKP